MFSLYGEQADMMYRGTSGECLPLVDGLAGLAPHNPNNSAEVFFQIPKTHKHI
jgi:hypothetical protein